MEENTKNFGLFSEAMDIQKAVVAISNDLVIAGKFCGSIASTAAITIDARAEVSGDIIAENVTIIGKFKGKIAARDLVSLKKGSVITGNVAYGRLNVEDGAVVCAATTNISGVDFKKTAEASKIYKSIKKPAAAPQK